jgi:hypothetical protein
MNKFSSNISGAIATYGPALSDYSTVYPSVESQSASSMQSNILWRKTLIDVTYEVQEKALIIPEEKVEESVDLPPVNYAAIELLRSWRENDDPEDEEEQKATWDFLKEALDEDRLSYRKLFPEHEVTSEQVGGVNGEHQTYPENVSNQNVVLSPEMQEFLQVLMSWCETDDQERIDTWEYLKQALDEDRPSDRNPFPEEEEKQISNGHNNSQGLEATVSAISVENEPSQGVVLSPEMQEFLEVLRSWREDGDEEDDEEQRATWEYLKKALDEDRLSYRKLFP